MTEAARSTTPKERPDWVLVLGILSIAFGAAAAAFCLLGAAVAFTRPTAAELRAPASAPSSYVGCGPYRYQPPDVVMKFWRRKRIVFLAGIPVSLLLVLGGSGLLRLARWGRSLCLAWVPLFTVLVLLNEAVAIDSGSNRWDYAVMSLVGLLTYPVTMVVFLLLKGGGVFAGRQRLHAATGPFTSS